MGQDNRKKMLDHKGQKNQNQESDETGDRVRKQPCIKNSNINQIQGPLQLLQDPPIIGINNNQFTKNMLMFKKEWEFLNYHTEFSKIKQDFQCCFQVLNDQNIAILLNGKQIFFWQDLDSQYDAYIIEDNDKGLMEPQLTKDESNIIYLSTSLYRQVTNELEYFQQNITKIYEIVQNEKYKSLVIPIIGQSQIFSYETACKALLISVIEVTNNLIFLEKIIIFERNREKLEIILNILLDLLNPQRQVKYQWQFYDQGWIDYASDINQQIDIAYEQYQKDKWIISKSNSMEFEIFKRKYKIIFGDNIVQINLQTNFERNVKYKYYVNQQKIKPLDEEQFNLLLQQPLNRLLIYQINIEIQSQDKNNLHLIEMKIRDLLERNYQIINWKVKNFKDDDLIIIEKKIRNRSIKFDKYGGINQKQHALLKKPKNQWIPQQQNLMKVKLNNNDTDYKKVQQLFQQSYPIGKIFQINRIQNKILYEKFINEKRKLIQIQQLQGQVLNQAELQTYLWHGVKSNHPSIIYNSIKEAFKNNYCNLSCLWGPGIYFASKAIYSKDYAYKLTPQESVYYPNKLIFLLCEVATGKCASLGANNRIKEPPNGYDCVVGKQQGTDIYVLYGMDVRRAYPSYEIIFE